MKIRRLGEPSYFISRSISEVGGLGIFMVKKIMDSVEYRREGSRNILVLKKRLLQEG